MVLWALNASYHLMSDLQPTAKHSGCNEISAACSDTVQTSSGCNGSLQIDLGLITKQIKWVHLMGLGGLFQKHCRAWTTIQKKKHQHRYLRLVSDLRSGWYGMDLHLFSCWQKKSMWANLIGMLVVKRVHWLKKVGSRLSPWGFQNKINLNGDENKRK